MQVHVFTQRIKEGEGKEGVGFRVVAEALPSALISLSRKEGGCLFLLDHLWEHDGHAPIFNYAVKREAYITRVVDDIFSKLDDALFYPWYKTSYTCVTTQDGTTWGTTASLDILPPLKINAPPQKFHGALESHEEEVKNNGAVIDPDYVPSAIDDPPIFNEDGDV